MNDVYLDLLFIILHRLSDRFTLINLVQFHERLFTPRRLGHRSLLLQPRLELLLGVLEGSITSLRLLERLIQVNLHNIYVLSSNLSLVG